MASAGIIAVNRSASLFLLLSRRPSLPASFAERTDQLVRGNANRLRLENRAIKLANSSSMEEDLVARSSSDFTHGCQEPCASSSPTSYVTIFRTIVSNLPLLSHLLSRLSHCFYKRLRYERNISRSQIDINLALERLLFPRVPLETIRGHSLPLPIRKIILQERKGRTKEQSKICHIPRSFRSLSANF